MIFHIKSELTKYLTWYRREVILRQTFGLRYLERQGSVECEGRPLMTHSLTLRALKWLRKVLTAVLRRNGGREDCRQHATWGSYLELVYNSLLVFALHLMFT